MATDRQRIMLDALGINYAPDITVEEAAELLRDHRERQGIKGPPRAPSASVSSALVVESEGDPGPGRQFTA